MATGGRPRLPRPRTPSGASERRLATAGLQSSPHDLPLRERDAGVAAWPRACPIVAAGSMASILHVSPETLEVLLRLAAAALVGTVLGVNRDLKRKPTGARTLALVCLGAALVAVAAVHYPGMAGSADAMSRVLQGIIQGVMTGVGFIGAGVIFRDRQQDDVRNLTTAATVWVTAALGTACALAAWEVVGIGAALTLLVLLLGAGLERRMVRLLGGAGGDD